MNRVISIGKQNFASLRENNNFYIDKTGFIKEWWETDDAVTLITRPRRFGKTLNMSMLECFFSRKFEGRSDLFEGLRIWEDEKYRALQGTYPVIFFSFADIKSDTYEKAMERIKENITRLYNQNDIVLRGDLLKETEKAQFRSVSKAMDDSTAETALQNLSDYLSRYYEKNVIILMDEYDTPMQEAWISGYWNEITAFFRSFFNATFKTNPYLERGIMTGITRVSKESIFSDLNNLKVVTTTSNAYASSFGFTEEEVFAALDEKGLSSEKEEVKHWYDGFIFGKQRDIYNPWSITNFLKEGEYGTYWADTSSNGLVSTLLREGDAQTKKELELLMQGGSLEKMIDEQIVFSQLQTEKNALWSLFLASGYLKADSYRIDAWSKQKICTLKITNFETLLMFHKMVKSWFASGSHYSDFIKALLSNDVELMNIFMNDVAQNSFSSFDAGKKPSQKKEPEKFYHGFVLGLLVELRERYDVRSNQESGYGRYDVCLVPKRAEDCGYIFEFKVYDRKTEKDLPETVAAALRQIEDKQYAQELLQAGVPEEKIRRYGFAFKGKKVLIG